MRKPNRPGWYWVKDTGTGESIRMWWNGVEYLSEDEIREINEAQEKEAEEDEQ